MLNQRLQKSSSSSVLSRASPAACSPELHRQRALQSFTGSVLSRASPAACSPELHRQRGLQSFTGSVLSRASPAACSPELHRQPALQSFTGSLLSRASPAVCRPEAAGSSVRTKEGLGRRGEAEAVRRDLQHSPGSHQTKVFLSDHLVRATLLQAEMFDVLSRLWMPL
ncbi:Hypothetical predicted protein [Scomber scombrus]|uniref:Uncharacterized protein n=1 Tax=Scomber scombrus TaxID=13677 RepID=A0AAV1QJK0_SCOSC